MSGYIWDTYGNQVKYISHRWEQLVFPYKFKLVAPKNYFEKNEVIFFAWDEEFKKYLVNNGVRKENIKVVGNIANNILFDLQNNQNDLKNRLSSDFSINKNKEWLFYH